MPYTWGLLDSLPADRRRPRATSCARSRGCRRVLITPPDGVPLRPALPVRRATSAVNEEPELTARARPTTPGALLRRPSPTGGSHDRRPRRRAPSGRASRRGRTTRPTSSRSTTSRSTSRSGPAFPAADRPRSRPSTTCPSRSGAARRSASSASRAAARARSAARSSGCASRRRGTVRFDGEDLFTLDARRAAQDAPADADHLPGPVRVARPAR